MKRFIIIPTLLLSLAGCGSLNKQFAVAYGTNTVTRNISSELLDAHVLKAVEGEKIKSVNDQVKEGLDLAWSIRNTQKDEARTQVQRHIDSVQEILEYLETKEIGK